ncbi:sensor histidine kinase [Paenibacillus solisilvae]|uniref:histidine kinase n=1 Tax=Paenibacillus solisilvae TaxID=2486751 RepID=A0ABW0VUN5_9BACL
MLFVWIVLWLVSALLLAANRSNPAGRWLSFVSFCGGMGALASVLEGWIVSLYGSGQIDASAERLLRIVQRGCSWMSYYGLPYAFLCFGAAYHSHALPAALGRRLSVITAVLPLGMLALPIADETPVHFSILGCWAIPYILIGALLLLTKKSVHPSERRAHRVLIAAVIPVILIALLMNFVLPLFGLFGMWRYNVWPIAVAFVIFIVALFNFGFLGVQLLIERRQLDYSLRAITSGTAMLNHAIKNDIGKIKLFSDKINRSAEASSELREDLRVITSATSHIESMIRSVHERTQELQLLPLRVNLALLVREQLQALEPRTSAGQIAVQAEYDEQAEAIADVLQTSEALSNVLLNAIEAMPGGGELHVKVIGGKRGSTIEVRDTGVGIEKQHLKKIVEPFFTTKSGRAMNFGLGLAYCYQLMNRQGGELRIQSEIGVGTIVRFHFPSLKRSKGVY